MVVVLGEQQVVEHLVGCGGRAVDVTELVATLLVSTHAGGVAEALEQGLAHHVTADDGVVVEDARERVVVGKGVGEGIERHAVDDQPFVELCRKVPVGVLACFACGLLFQ